ncbi:FAD/NAD(P)-binding protein [Yoonia sp. 2307UL14-13]|uniref:FAD/NAD(P)-binding protein n=1 Tax=Yoonia sp. 2307UL14-13 TaxID=3126506 RepID=UPI0030A78401
MNAPSTAQTATHVIVGDGITALAFLEHCDLRAGETLIILGKMVSRFGRGMAYAKGDPDTPWRYAYLLNSPADDIDPAFAAWLSDRWDNVSDTMSGRSPDWLHAAAPLVAAGDIYGVNAPREFYGDFMEELARIALSRLEKRGVRIVTLNDCVTSIAPAENGVVLKTEKGAQISAESVDIAPGGPSTMRLAGDDGTFAAPSVFGQEPRIAEHIRAGAEIFCIGGNAAMLDVLRLCQSLIPNEDIKMVVCAPDGDIPAPLVPRLPRKLTKPTLTRGHDTAKSFLSEIEDEIASARRNGDEMREIRAGFRAHFLANPLNLYLADLDEARQVPSKLRFWLRGGTRDTILDMHRLVGEGRVKVVPGLVKSVEHGKDGATVYMRDPSGGEFTHNTGFVVNCAGAGPNSRYDPLTADMLAKSVIEICPVSRGIKVGAVCQTTLPGVRYLSPAVTEIGEEPIAMPLYDAHMLRTYAARANGLG